MVSSGLRFDPEQMSLRALTRSSQPEMLPLCSPTRGPNNVITQVLTSNPILVD